MTAWRVTRLDTRESRTLYELYYVQMGPNGWESTGGKPSEYVAAGEFGLCRIWDGTDYDGDLPEVRIVPDNGEVLNETAETGKTHTGQIDDLEACTAEQTIESGSRLDDIEAVLAEIVMGGA